MKCHYAFPAMLAIMLFTISAFPQEETRLLRFPASHGNQLVFSYAGDLYTVPVSGGMARRLTGDIGYEMFARFSPDGQNIAFTAQYDGNTEVYLMPAQGGVPQRLTYTATLDRDDVADRMGPNNIVMGWKNNEQILYRSRKDQWNDFKGDLLLASTTGGLSEPLPLPRGGFASYAPDGQKLAYNRIFREFRTWKRYRGGQADDIWIYDFATKKTSNITNNPAQDIIPMWSGDTIYFISDRDENKRFNLYAYDIKSKKLRQLTRFTEFDIKFPSLGNDAIVFENGGWIYRFDLKTGKVAKIPITISDDQVGSRGGWTYVGNEISNYEIAPDGARALFGAHGEIFTVPAKNGNTRNLTGTSGIHERASKWSPDGKWIAFIADASGEDEIWIMPQDGSAPARQLTSGADTYKFSLLWSPDSGKILWNDQKQRLQYVAIDSGEVTQVAQAAASAITQYNWSPDSRWITWAQAEEKQMQTIYLYALDSRETIAATDGWFASSSPVFSADGKYLFFVSARTFNPVYGSLEYNYIYQGMNKIYALALTADTPSLFAPKSDEVKIKDDVKIKEGIKKEAGAKPGDVGAPGPAATLAPTPATPTITVKVDVAGLRERIEELPGPTGGYYYLVATEGRLYYLAVRGGALKLTMFDLNKRQETVLGDATGYEISADARKILIAQNAAYAIIDLPAGPLGISEWLNLSDLRTNIDRAAEWRQIFHESWRQMRDFLYAPNLHGVDWTQIRKNYEPLLAFVRHRADLTYVIGEMISELNVGHAYVGGGAQPRPQRVALGLLGAVLKKDPDSGFFRIERILRGDNWNKAIRSPLTEIGVEARAGDYILEINGKPTSQIRDIYEVLVNTAGRQVKLRLGPRPENGDSREVTVTPLSDEHPLYYHDWVQGNLEKVEKATNGRVGYIHIPDMQVEGLNAFVRYFYPQFRKEALIIDVRGNGGGNVSAMIIERLRREAATIDIARNSTPVFDPEAIIPGPKVALIDEFSASDGDIFAYRFRHHQLGKLIGKRTWGGVVGIGETLPLLDGGSLNRPQFSRYDLAGKEWIMEGHGVDPDIVVDNDPAREYAGEDEQLDRAIAEILKEMKNKPVKLAPPPPWPVK